MRVTSSPNMPGWLRGFLTALLFLCLVHGIAASPVKAPVKTPAKAPTVVPAKAPAKAPVKPPVIGPAKPPTKSHTSTPAKSLVSAVGPTKFVKPTGPFAPFTVPDANSFQKRGFEITEDDAAQVLKANNFDGSKAIFFSRPATALLWAKKLGQIPITQAYGDFANPTKSNSPLFVTGTPTEADIALEGRVWNALSAAYANSVPAGSTVTVCLNPGVDPRPGSNWLTVELPILKNKGCIIMQANAKDVNSKPVQIFPPPSRPASPGKSARNIEEAIEARDIDVEADHEN